MVAVSMNAVWLFYFCVYAVKSVESSHFMGGAIQWRPIKPAAFDGRVSQSSPHICDLSLRPSYQGLDIRAIVNDKSDFI